MTKAIRLTVALMAALAFTAARADDSADDKKCDGKDMPCASAMTQEGSSEASDSSASSGSGAGEASSASDVAANQLYWENQQHEHWESGD